MDKCRCVFDEVATGKVEIDVEFFEVQVCSTVLAVKVAIHYCWNVVCNKLFGKARLIVTAVEWWEVHDSNDCIGIFAHFAHLLNGKF